MKTKRAALDPRALRLKVSTRRRAAGLLREEVAQVAGISTTWYTWLEQGRVIHPSATVLESLVGALRLSKAERRHLYRLARPDLEARERTLLTTRMSPRIRSAIDGLAPHPAYAVTGAWDVLGENEPAQRVLGSFFGSNAHEPDVLARLLLDPDWHALFVEHATIVESAIQQFRATTARTIADPIVRGLIESFRARSSTFAKLWPRAEVAELPAWRKALRHPSLGERRFDYATFHPDAEPEDVRITVYMPADAATRASLARMRDTR